MGEGWRAVRGDLGASPIDPHRKNGRTCTLRPISTLDDLNELDICIHLPTLVL